MLTFQPTNKSHSAAVSIKVFRNPAVSRASDAYVGSVTAVSVSLGIGREVLTTHRG